MRLLKPLTKLVRKAYGDLPTDPVEFYANLPLAKAVTPDGIIAASLIDRMARDFGCVVMTSVSKTANYHRPSHNPEPIILRFTHVKMPTCVLTLTLDGWSKGKPRYNDGVGPWWWHPTGEVAEATIDGVSIDRRNGIQIWNAYNQLSVAHKAAQEASAKAKANMEANERKWNLAESLLGMKRNEFGALVPITSAD